MNKQRLIRYGAGVGITFSILFIIWLPLIIIVPDARKETSMALGGLFLAAICVSGIQELLFPDNLEVLIQKEHLLNCLDLEEYQK